MQDQGAARLQNPVNLREKPLRPFDVFGHHVGEHHIEKGFGKGNLSLAKERPKPLRMGKLGVSDKIGAPHLAGRGAIRRQIAMGPTAQIEHSPLFGKQRL